MSKPRLILFQLNATSPMVPNVSEVALTRPYVGPSDPVPNHVLPLTGRKLDDIDGGGTDASDNSKESLKLKWESVMGQKFKIVVRKKWDWFIQ